MSMLISLVLRYLPQILGAIAIIGLYFWWRGEIITETENRINAEWIARDAETQKKTNELVAKKNKEIEEVKKHQSEVYIGAIESYAEHIQNLNTELAANRDKRLFISTKANSCGNTLSTTASGAKDANRGDEEIYRAELEPEITATIRANAAEVERGKLACAELLKIVTESMEIK